MVPVTDPKTRSYLFLVAGLLVIIGFSLLLLLPTKSPTTDQSASILETTTPTADVSFSPFTARFLIFTNGTRRNFDNAMYHGLSETVYLTASDSTLIYVEQPGITWGDFFATLPFEINGECLVTGTGQEFCQEGRNQLRFYINGEISNNIFDRPINPNDRLLVTYGSGDQQITNQQLQDLQQL